MDSFINCNELDNVIVNTRQATCIKFAVEIQDIDMKMNGDYIVEGNGENSIFLLTSIITN